MGTISQKLEYLNTTKGKIKDSINITGANIGANDTFRSYSTKLRDGLVNAINDGGATIYNNFPKTTGTGSDITLNDTYNSKLKVDLKGNTYQASDPTPSSPQDIEVVTGYNNIEVVGKNLLDYTKSVNGSIATNSTSEELTPSNNTITSIWMLCKPNTSYTISGGNNRKRWQTKDINGNITFVANDSTTITTNSTARYIRVYYYYLSGGVNPQSITDVMINEGSSALDFEPYQGQSYEINLGKNLFDADTIIPATITARGYSANASYNSTTKVLSFTAINNDTFMPGLWDEANYINDINVDVKQNTNYIFSFSTNNTTNVRIGVYGTDGSKYYAIQTPTATTRLQFNSGSYSKIALRFGNNNNNGNTITFSDMQLELGTEATPFSPYKTPIELCKIGTYQDYIYKENNKWYIHKEIGKVVLDETSGFNQLNTQGFTLSASNWASITNNNCLNNSQLLSKYYKNYSDATEMINSNFGIALLYPTAQNLYIQNKSISTVSDFNTWLSTNNTEVYYVLATPTVTILDDELQNELNALESANSYTGVTNITAEYISGNQPFDMSASALLKE